MAAVCVAGAGLSRAAPSTLVEARGGFRPKANGRGGALGGACADREPPVRKGRADAPTPRPTRGPRRRAAAGRRPGAGRRDRPGARRAKRARAGARSARHRTRAHGARTAGEAGRSSRDDGHTRTGSTGAGCRTAAAADPGHHHQPRRLAGHALLVRRFHQARSGGHGHRRRRTARWQQWPTALRALGHAGRQRRRGHRPRCHRAVLALLVQRRQRDARWHAAEGLPRVRPVRQRARRRGHHQHLWRHPSPRLCELGPMAGRPDLEQLPGPGLARRHHRPDRCHRRHRLRAPSAVALHDGALGVLAGESGDDGRQLPRQRRAHFLG